MRSTFLSGVNMIGASISNTIVSGLDLSDVLGLEHVKHDGPSTIGIDTLYKSKGEIPESFLRGCGVHDNMIEYSRALTASPIQYYSCFISYSHKDEAFARRLFADLQANNVRCWFAPHELISGEYLHDQIDKAIRVHEKLLLILSDHSMDSQWVKTEILKAKKREDHDGKRMLFPISLVEYSKIESWVFFDHDSGRDLAKDIRRYYIPYFDLWEDDYKSYEKGLDTLLKSFQVATLS